MDPQPEGIIVKSEKYKIKKTNKNNKKKKKKYSERPWTKVGRIILSISVCLDDGCYTNLSTKYTKRSSLFL